MDSDYTPDTEDFFALARCLVRAGERPTTDVVERVRIGFTSLPERDQEVLRRRFGIDGGNPELLTAIGADLGLTAERVRQIEGKALRRLMNQVKGEEV